jgi:hypothetical protein
MDDADVPEPVRTAWQRTIEAWDQPVLHDAFLGAVAQHGVFTWAAARYKERAGDVVAVRQLERLRSAATAVMLAGAMARPAKRTKPYQVTIAVLIALVIVAVVGYFYTVHLHDLQTPPAKPAAP